MVRMAAGASGIRNIQSNGSMFVIIYCSSGCRKHAFLLFTHASVSYIPSRLTAGCGERCFLVTAAESN